MKVTFNSEAFAKAIKTKRIIEMNVGLREVSKKIKISPATISRYENQEMPDLLNYAVICKWLGVEMSKFIK